MNPEVLKCYLEAGRIASKVRDQTVRTVEEGNRLLQTAQYAENLIDRMGGQLAFPCTVSINEVASHYTPLHGTRTFAAGDLVKIDLGVHINGYIADTAITVEVGTSRNGILIDASKKALQAAIDEIRDGVKTQHLGNVMGKIIRSMGCTPMPDLTGHSLDRFVIHSGVNIPSDSGTSYGNTLYAGDVVAVEPFTTFGRGKVKHGEVRIYSMLMSRNTEDRTYWKLRARFNALPFTSRWLEDPKDLERIRSHLRKYPVLIESDGCPVAQAEHTVIVDNVGCRVITA